ncbi:MAG TPA: RNA polymerase sigma factor [Terriglobales bacterium]|jgi:RNA polymerase sigma-70 factor (ECF subfamily)|nr:RNA polymerase sigma factor [Terriglobales bacterium]
MAMQSTAIENTGVEALADTEVIRRVLSGETALYEIIMRRYNQRLYRVVRAILRDDDEVEDVMQDAYVRAYRHLADFAGRSQFSTWLIRIAVHEAFSRARKSKRLQPIDEVFTDGGADMIAANSLDPERQTSNGELARVLEGAILSLPEHLRTVLMLRDVEELSTAETAAALELSEENVKTRLHRGRAIVRKNICQQVGSDAAHAFMFMGVRCDRVVQRVFAALGEAHNLEHRLQ